MSEGLLAMELRQSRSSTSMELSSAGLYSISATLKLRGEDALAVMVEEYAQLERQAVNLSDVVELARRGLRWSKNDVRQAVEGLSKLGSAPFEVTAEFFRLLAKWSKMSMGRTGREEYLEVTRQVATGLRRIFYASAVVYAVYRAAKWVSPRAKEAISRLVSKIKKAKSDDEVAKELVGKDNREKQEIIESLLAAGHGERSAAVLPIEIAVEGSEATLRVIGLESWTRPNSIAYEGKTYNLEAPHYGPPGRETSKHPIINPQPPAAQRTQPVDQKGEERLLEVPKATIKIVDEKDKKKDKEEEKEAAIIEIEDLEVPEGKELVIHETYGRQPFFKKPWRKDVDPEYLERKYKILRKLKKRKLDERTERISSLME